MKTSEFFCKDSIKECDFRSDLTKDELYMDYGRFSLTGLKNLFPDKLISAPDISK